MEQSESDEARHVLRLRRWSLSPFKLAPGSTVPKSLAPRSVGHQGLSDITLFASASPVPRPFRSDLLSLAALISSATFATSVADEIALLE